MDRFQVHWNAVPGMASVGSTQLTFQPSDAVASTRCAFSFAHVKQVMVSKKRPLQVRFVVETPPPALTSTVDVTFELQEHRDALISCVASHDGKASSNSSAKPAVPPAVPSIGLQDVVSIKQELEELRESDALRGSVFVFEAITRFIDPETLQLRPITEQMEADALRQNPALAAVFVRRVHSEEERRMFWEAVVRKCFCFTKSFLDTELLQQQQPQEGEEGARKAPSLGPPLVVESSIGVTGADATDVVSGINEASAIAVKALRPLFNGKRNRVGDAAGWGQSNEDTDVHHPQGLGQALEEEQVNRRWRSLLFSKTAEACATNGEPCAEGDSRCEATPSYPVWKEPPQLLLTVPEGARDDKVLRLLRSFWGEAATDRGSLAAQLCAELPRLKPDSVMWRCAQAALAFTTSVE